MFKETPWLKDVVAMLEPLGFARQGTVLVRESESIQQIVGTICARFGDPNEFWVEVVLRLAPAKKRIHNISSAQGTKETIASIRMDEIDPTVPPYFDLTTPTEWTGHLDRVLLPFLQSTRTVPEVIKVLRNRGDFDMAAAVLCAKTGDLDQARTLFQQAPGDRTAISRLAAQFGIQLV